MRAFRKYDLILKYCVWLKKYISSCGLKDFGDIIAGPQTIAYMASHCFPMNAWGPVSIFISKGSFGEKCLEVCFWSISKRLTQTLKQWLFSRGRNLELQFMEWAWQKARVGPSLGLRIYWTCNHLSLSIESWLTFLFIALYSSSCSENTANVVAHSIHCAVSMSACVCTQSCLTVCHPMDSSPPGCSVCGIFKARILEWVAISSSEGSSRPRDQTQVSCIPCIGRWILYHLSHLGSPHYVYIGLKKLLVPVRLPN